MRRMRVLKRFGKWHWWCPCCMGGDWTDEAGATHTSAREHARLQH